MIVVLCHAEVVIDTLVHVLSITRNYSCSAQRRYAGQHRAASQYTPWAVKWQCSVRPLRYTDHSLLTITQRPGENASGRAREVMTMIYMDKNMILAKPKVRLEIGREKCNTKSR